MLTLSNSKQQRLIYICFIMYTSVYLAKLNYNALIIEILADLGGTKSAAGLVGSFFFFSYGIGQVVNGFSAKYMNEKYVMTVSLLGSSLCNIAMAFAPSVGVMKYIWLINGMVLSTLWCNVVKVQGKYISSENLPKALMVMGFTTPVGTAVNYGLCALVSRLTSWRVQFWIAGALMGFMAVLWFATLSDTERCAGSKIIPDEETENKEIGVKLPGKKITIGVIVCLAAMFLTGMCTQFTREGLNSWVPSILHEIYKMSSTQSIALTLFIPLLSSLSSFILILLERKCKDFLVLSMIFSSAAAIFMAVLVGCYSLNSVVITFVCFIAVSMGSTGIASITTNHIPLYYRDRFDPGMMAGVGQGFCYIGSTLSIYTLGYVADNGGWFNVFLMLAVVVSASVVMCVVAKLITRERHTAPKNT